MATQTTQGPQLSEGTITFRLLDEEHRYEAVRLYQEIARPRLGPSFTFVPRSGMWELQFPDPSAGRMEYLFEVTHRDGSTEWMVDPHNERRAPGPFGEKSELLFDRYERPTWLDEIAEPGEVRSLEVRCRPFRARLPVLIWSPPGTSADEPLPLLLVHDGPEFAEYAELRRYLEVMTSERRIPPLRAALIGPVERDQSYSASASYARSFAHEILPILLRAAPTPHGRSTRIGMGSSLGALSMLHIHRREPGTLGGLVLMSGSYFRQRYDPQEAGFVRFRRISRFIGGILTAESWMHPVPALLTCGTIEENLANNRAVQGALRQQGYETILEEHPDAHNWTAWRDVLDPHVTRFLARRWG